MESACDASVVELRGSGVDKQADSRQRMGAYGTLGFGYAAEMSGSKGVVKGASIVFSVGTLPCSGSFIRFIS